MATASSALESVSAAPHTPLLLYSLAALERFCSRNSFDLVLASSATGSRDSSLLLPLVARAWILVASNGSNNTKGFAVRLTNLMWEWEMAGSVLLFFFRFFGVSRSRKH